MIPGLDPNTTPNPDDPNAIWEGIGSGWYFSEAGGGVDLRPDGLSTTLVTDDNTEVPKPKEAVPTVFNGDFENGTRQSILNWIDGTDKGRFPLSYELPGWSFHGGQGFELAPSVSNLVGDALSLSGPLFDIAGFFVIETDPTELVKSVLKKAWEAGAKKLLEFAKNKLTDQPDSPTGTSSQGYRDWYDENWGDGTENKAKKDLSDTIFDFIDKKINEMAQAGLGAFDLEQAVQIGDEPNNPLGFDGLKSYIEKGIDEGFAGLFPDSGDHAFIMGAGQILRDVVGALVPAPLEEFSDALVNAIAQLDSITHNRLYVPPELPLLSFDAFAPYMYTVGAGVEVKLEVDDLPPFVETIPLDPGFFNNHTYSVCVPEEYRGRMATITYTHQNLEESTHVSFDPSDLVPGALDNPLSTASQFFLMDDVRFEQLYDDMVTVSSDWIPETDEVTLTVTLDPQLSDRSNSISIDFGAGEGAPIVIDLPQGQLWTTVTHTYDDDNPTGTPSDVYDVTVTVNGSACQTYVKHVTVENIVPEITIDNISAGNQSSADIDEGDSITVEYTVTEIATEDQLELVVEWDPDTTETIMLDMDGETTKSFSIEHTYADDNPTGTPIDEVVVSLKVIDDDTGMGEATFDLTIRNVDPEFTVTPSRPLNLTKANP